MIHNFDDFNYLEINLINKFSSKDKKLNLDNNLSVIDINWSEIEFNKILLKFINKYKLKPFEKKFRILQHYDTKLIYNINDNKYTANKQYFVSNNNNDNYILIKYQKENIPPVNFPSTRDINDMYYVNKVIFKVTNRIYINFELKKKNRYFTYF